MSQRLATRSRARRTRTRTAPSHAPVVLTVTGVALVAGCSSAGSTGSQSTPVTTPVSASASSAGTEEGAGPAASPPQPTLSPSARASSRPLVCSRPSQDLLNRVAADIDQHPGRTTAASLVRAGQTPTGTWYVVAIERSRVSDHDGSAIPGRSIGVGLTNIPAYREVPRLIPLGDSTTGAAPSLSWDRVSWTGDLLQEGKRAAGKALSCIGH